MARSLADGARLLGKWADNVNNEVPRHGVKAVATRFKVTTQAMQHTHTMRNFGKTGGSNVGVGVHFKITGSGGNATALVTTYGPFGIEESGARTHIILPKAGRGTTRSGRTRTRRGAQSIVAGRLAKGKGFRSLEGGTVTEQHALHFGSTFTPYVKHPGTKGHGTWKKGVAVIGPQARAIYERSVRIGMRVVGL